MGFTSGVRDRSAIAAAPLQALGEKEEEEEEVVEEEEEGTSVETELHRSSPTHSVGSGTQRGYIIIT